MKKKKIKEYYKFYTYVNVESVESDSTNYGYHIDIHQGCNKFANLIKK